jgi:hypothetical protein
LFSHKEQKRFAVGAFGSTIFRCLPSRLCNLQGPLFQAKEIGMNRHLVPLVSLLLASSVPAFAQSGDAAYCTALSDLARRYLGNTADGRNVPDADTNLAIINCQKGNTAAGIPVLEKKLRDARFTLPKRS